MSLQNELQPPTSCLPTTRFLSTTINYLDGWSQTNLSFPLDSDKRDFIWSHIPVPSFLLPWLDLLKGTLFPLPSQFLEVRIAYPSDLYRVFGLVWTSSSSWWLCRSLGNYYYWSRALLHLYLLPIFSELFKLHLQRFPNSGLMTCYRCNNNLWSCPG